MPQTHERVAGFEDSVTAGGVSRAMMEHYQRIMYRLSTHGHIGASRPRSSVASRIAIAEGLEVELDDGASPQNSTRTILSAYEQGVPIRLLQMDTLLGKWQSSVLGVGAFSADSPDRATSMIRHAYTVPEAVITRVTANGYEEESGSHIGVKIRNMVESDARVLDSTVRSLRLGAVTVAQYLEGDADWRNMYEEPQKFDGVALAVLEATLGLPIFGSETPEPTPVWETT